MANAYDQPQRHFIYEDLEHGEWADLPNISTSGYRALKRVNQLSQKIETYVGDNQYLVSFITRLLTWLYEVRLKLPRDLIVTLTTHRGYAAVEIAIYRLQPPFTRTENLLDLTHSFVTRIESEPPYAVPVHFAICWILVGRESVDRDKIHWHGERVMSVVEDRLEAIVNIGGSEDKFIFKLGNSSKDIKVKLRMRSAEKDVVIPKHSDGFALYFGEGPERVIINLKKRKQPTTSLVVQIVEREEIITHYGEEGKEFRSGQFDLFSTLLFFPPESVPVVDLQRAPALGLGCISRPGNDGTELDGVITDRFDCEAQRDPVNWQGDWQGDWQG
ncbi:hypothetical protein F5Y09DRAFT_340490 [Xylaria sp. FL1042]|nr:hypothetical protein F5Y09DRAFT_340490 [Xylaria sp. FL1042]